MAKRTGMRIGAALALLIATVGFTMAASAAPPSKVEVCHVDDDGNYRKISVSENAYDAHLDHGDGSPNGSVPGRIGFAFDGTCHPVDVQAPVAPAAPADVSVQCAADVPPPVDLTAVDNADGPITVSPSAQITPGGSLNDFVMVRTWTFADAAGNTSSVSQTITVLDTVAPIAPAAPADVTVEGADAVPPPIDLTAVDNCDGPITVSPSAQITPGGSPNDFVMVRTWTFADAAGNTSSVSQTITVVEPVAEEIIYAVAYGDVDPNDGGYNPSVDVLIAKLVEDSGDTVLSPGDAIIVDRYPIGPGLLGPVPNEGWALDSHVVRTVDTFTPAGRCGVQSTDFGAFYWDTRFGAESYDESRFGSSFLQDGITNGLDQVRLSSQSPSAPNDLVLSVTRLGDDTFIDVDLDC